MLSTLCFSGSGAGTDSQNDDDGGDRDNEGFVSFLVPEGSLDKTMTSSEENWRSLSESDEASLVVVLHILCLVMLSSLLPAPLSSVSLLG